MGKVYTKQEIIEKCEKGIKDVKQFYNDPVVNYRSKTKDTKEYCTEVVAEFLLQDDIFKLLNSIKMIDRNDYSVGWHDGGYDIESNRFEEHLAMDMFKTCKNGGHSFDGIGQITGYQVPLKSRMEDAVGKIDLLSKNKDIAYILELKAPGNVETMLRCILEGFTYLKTVNQEKLIKSLNDERVKRVTAAPLVSFKGYQWEEMHQDRPNLKRLMEKIQMTEVFYYRVNDIKYEIVM